MRRRDHREEARQRADDPDRKFLQSRVWREKIRPFVLMDRGSLCEHCKALGKLAAATQVDHVERPFGDEQKQRDPENFQILCADHHQRKSAWERDGKRLPLVIGYTAQGWTVTSTDGRAPDGGTSE